MAAATRQRRRADAERSIAAILDAAVDALGERPDASMEDLAKAAGVARQTIYAHFDSREALLAAVQQRALAQAVAAIDAAHPEEGPPAEALDRLITASWQTLERHARLLESFFATRGPEEIHALHRPIRDRLEPLIRRGRREGAFDRRLSLAWVFAAVIGLFHATAQEVGAGRMSAEAGGRALRRAIPRLLGAGDSGSLYSSGT
jgi:AcrR family transcriptional regulator